MGMTSTEECWRPTCSGFEVAQNRWVRLKFQHVLQADFSVSRDANGSKRDAMFGKDGGALFELKRGVEIGGGVEGVLA